MNGTPKTFPELVRNELQIGPLSTLEHRLIHGFKDYLAQHFQAEMFKSNDDKTYDLLITLYERLTKDIK